MPTVIVAVTMDAAARLIRPLPRSIGFGNGLPVDELLTGLAAHWTRADLTWAGDHVGGSCFSNAAAPATCGVAIEVPWKNAKQGGLAQELIRIELYTFTPGATTSGLTSFSRVLPMNAGPLLENPAIMSALGPSVKNSILLVPSIETVFVLAAAIACPLGLDTMTAGIVGWPGVPSWPIAVG